MTKKNFLDFATLKKKTGIIPKLTQLPDIYELQPLRHENIMRQMTGDIAILRTAMTALKAFYETMNVTTALSIKNDFPRDTWAYAIADAYEKNRYDELAEDDPDLDAIVEPDEDVEF